MGMRQQKSEIMTAGRKKRVSRLTNTGTGINDQYFVIICPDFETSGVATVPQILFARNRDRASGAPTANNHFSPWRLF
jgi:hypothetical protein